MNWNMALMTIMQVFTRWEYWSAIYALVDILDAVDYKHILYFQKLDELIATTHLGQALKYD